MNLLAARVTLRVRGMADILDLALPFSIGNRRVLAPLALIVLLPSLLLCLALHRFAAWSWPAVWTVAVVLGGLWQGLFTLAAGEALFHAPASIKRRALLGRFVRALPRYLGAHLLSRLAIAASACIVIVLPSVAVNFAFVHEAVLLEGARPFGALSRSARFVQRQGWSTFGLVLAMSAAPVLGVFAGEMAGQSLVQFVFQLGMPAGDLLQDGGSAYALIGFFLAVPFTTAARFLKYIDIRTRKEGWDIQIRFMAIASAAAPPARTSEDAA